MTDPSGFTKLVPGFEFMQTLVKNAGAAMPGIGQWVAPTIDPVELAKRIEELRTVQFWLEQNARMLGATIQAMEVQRMTLSTLKTMNVQMEDLRDALTVSIPGMTAPATPAATPKSAPDRHAAPAPAADATPRPPAVDPMQWWGALAQQFTELATRAMRDPALATSSAGASPSSAGASTASAPMSDPVPPADGGPPGAPGAAPRAMPRPVAARKAGASR